MTSPREGPAPDEHAPRGLLTLALATLLAAAAVGFIGGAFRWCLQQAITLRADLVEWAHGVPLGWLAPVAVAALGGLIGRLVVKASPRSSGSGIQDVEAVWRGEKDLPGPSIVPGKFVGGLASIGTGMVLGREGPTVHMGSTLGSEAGRLLRVSTADRKLLYTTLGGAGLAVAFNAPIGGAMFALEEVTKSFRLRIVLLTLMATAVAVACSRVVLGDSPDFAVPAIPTPGIETLWVFALFGVLTGLVGVLYNRVVMRMLYTADGMRRLSPVSRATLIGAIVGALLYVDPNLVGGGDSLTQDLITGMSLSVWGLLGFFAVRFLMGPLSYAAGTPGGLFAPLLALGALWGALVHSVAGPLLGEVADSRLPLALVGMTALFAATVRAPVTGIVLIVEMTAITSLTVPMLAACACAVLTATLLRSAPIYDSLRERMLNARVAGPGEAGP